MLSTVVLGIGRRRSSSSSSTTVAAVIGILVIVIEMAIMVGRDTEISPEVKGPPPQLLQRETDHQFEHLITAYPLRQTRQPLPQLRRDIRHWRHQYTVKWHLYYLSLSLSLLWCCWLLIEKCCGVGGGGNV